MRVDAKYNPDTKKYDVVDADTGTPLMHQTHGNRVDGADTAPWSRQNARKDISKSTTISRKLKGRCHE